MDCQDLDSVYAARVLLEPLALRMTVPRLRTADLSVLRDRLVAMRRLGAQVEIASWENAHRVFHRRLISAAPAPLREQIETLMERADRYRRIAVHDDTEQGRAAGDAEHEAIVEACEARDAGRAAAVLRAQLVRSARTAQAIVLPGAELPALEAALEAL